MHFQEWNIDSGPERSKFDRISTICWGLLLELGNLDSFSLEVLVNLELPVSGKDWITWVNTSVKLIQDLDTLEIVLEQIRNVRIQNLIQINIYYFFQSPFCRPTDVCWENFPLNNLTLLNFLKFSTKYQRPSFSEHGTMSE